MTRRPVDPKESGSGEDRLRVCQPLEPADHSAATTVRLDDYYCCYYICIFIVVVIFVMNVAHALFRPYPRAHSSSRPSSSPKLESVLLNLQLIYFFIELEQNSCSIQIKLYVGIF